MRTVKALYATVGLTCLAAAVAVTGGAGEARAQSSAAAAVLAFDKAGAAPARKYRIAYVTECVQNPYCQARLHGLEDAAKKYGFEFKVFDANFNPAEQLKQAQNAAAEGFDAYLFAPAASAPGCSTWKQFLVPTGKPVVTLDLPMCGDADYTKGLAATVTMQSQAYFDAHIDQAFASCKEACKVAAIGGFAGSDLFNFWEKALKKGAEKYKNVTVVVDQPGNFDPATALRVMQDGLRANPDITVAVSPWDDETRGIAQAIENSGKKAGSDVRIYSIGASKDGVERVKKGNFTETSVLLPWEESYYASVAAIMALEGHPVNGYVNEAELPRVTEGPGTVFITQDNAGKFTPNY